LIRRNASTLRFRESGSTWLICQQASPVREQLCVLWIGARSQFVKAAIDIMFMFCSYAATEREAAMDNRINDIRRTIRALRVSMREAEAIMHEQINRDEDCSFVAQELIKMRLVMSLLAKERTALGDNELILVNSFFIPRRRPTRKPAAAVAPTVASVFGPRLAARA
jgi:hypothetical protein